jgi:hypothetical protein
MSEKIEQAAAQGQEAQDAEAAAEAEFAAAFAKDTDGTGHEPPAGGADEEKGGQPGDEDGDSGTAAQDEEAAKAAEDAAEDGKKPASKDKGDPGDKGEDDPEELRRKARLYEHNEGRLRKTQEELDQARRELDKVKNPQPEQPKALKLEDLPEELRPDVESFAKANPELAAVMLEDSRQGKRLRRALEENGPGAVLVEDMAERMAEARKGEAERSRREAEEFNAVKQGHFDAIGHAHPDFGEAYAKRIENPDAFTAYLQKLEEWAEGKSGKDYKRIGHALKEGTSAEVIAVLAEFKKDKDDRASGRRDETRRAAENATVPKGKPSPPPDVEAPGKGDFDKGWKEAGKK